jgi:plasmid stability protein
MATLYVENVPDDRYEALKARAAENKRSITAEILNLLEHSYPTPAEREERFSALNELFEKLKKNPVGPGPSGVEMLREDRDR